MVDPGLVAAKLAELSDRLARVRSKCPPNAVDFATDRDALEIVSLNLMLAVQSCADLASHLIADEGWPSAPTLAGTFHRLRDQGVISPATSTSLAQAVGLRNVIAHGYAGINPAMVHAAASGGLADLERFAREVAAWACRAAL